MWDQCVVRCIYFSTERNTGIFELALEKTYMLLYVQIVKQPLLGEPNERPTLELNPKRMYMCVVSFAKKSGLTLDCF